MYTSIWIVLGIIFVLFIIIAKINNIVQEDKKKKIREAHIERMKKQRAEQELLDGIRLSYKDDLVLNFAVKGLLYRDVAAKNAAQNLKIGDRLQLFWDEGNKEDIFATKVLTLDNYFIGYVDRRTNNNLHWIIRQIDNCIVSKIETGEKLPFIYAEAYFKKETVEFMTYEDAKRLIIDQGYSILTSKYYSKEFKKEKISNIFGCIELLKKKHPSMNANIVYADILLDALDKAYDYYSEDEKYKVLMLQLDYKCSRAKRHKITIDDWDKVLDCCEHIK